MRRWSADLGDPGRPRSVAGVAVSRVLCRRQDGAAALVVLTDGRLALTGPVLAAGAADDVAAYLRQRAGHAVTAREVGWLALCSHTLAAERETNPPVPRAGTMTAGLTVGVRSSARAGGSGP